jgi:hypothetical protein
MKPDKQEMMAKMDKVRDNQEEIIKVITEAC